MGADNELIAAAGFAASRPAAEPLLDHAARALAYTRYEVTINTKGQHEVDTVSSLKNGVKQAPITVALGDAHYSFPMSIKLSAQVDSQSGSESADLRLGRTLFPIRDHFQIVTHGANASTLEGECKTSHNLTTCDQTVSDGSGRPILLARSISNYENNHDDFVTTTDFYDPTTKAFKAESWQRMVTSDIGGGNKSMKIETILDPHATSKVPLEK